MTIQEYVEENYGEELRAEGRKEGYDEAMEKMYKLNLLLSKVNRQDELVRAMHDPEFRKKLFEEFGI